MVVPKGGPQGPFYGAINSKGNVVALQIVNEPDARLIAAAPELLEALQGLVKAEFAEDLKPYWTKAHAAIAKATGVQP